MKYSALTLTLALALLSGLFLSTSPAAEAASYVVDTTSDTSLTACTGAAADCSLRGAITNANGTGPGDTITFDPAVFTGTAAAPTTIAIASTLPNLTGGGDTIDGGVSQSVLIDAPDPQSSDCLIVFSSSNTVKRLQFKDCFTAVAIVGGNTNTIGPANVIFDSVFGININTDTATSNVIKGNRVGTTADGTAAHPDGGNSIGIQTAGNSTVIGGLTPGDGNLASNNSTGIRILGGTGSQILGNVVGLNATGGAAIGNTNAGIMVAGGSGTVGSAAPGGRNWVSGNSRGIVLTNSSTSGVVVQGNWVGIEPAGAGFPNSDNGIHVDGGAHDNLIGGTESGQGNVIAFNGGVGVNVVGATSTGNRIRGNSIHDNGGAEIHLLAGGNAELAPPTIVLAGAGALSGSSGCGSCIVDVYSDNGGDAEVFEGTTTADGGGSWVLYNEMEWSNVVATVTDSLGNTSRLSVSVPIPTGPDFDDDNIPDELDNCFDIVNGPREEFLLGIGNQTDADGDGVPGSGVPLGSNFGGDACDVDDDNDGIADTMDICRTLAEDYDGFEDGDTCPDTDNDGDGICDAGLAGLSCTGSDTGRYLWQNPLGGTVDCRNVAEDFDSFHDGDGCPESDNDYDTFPDGTDDCPGADTNVGADGIADTGDEPVLYLTPYQAREDFDGVIDWDGCHDSPDDDYDGDAIGDETEVFTLGTDPVNPDTDGDGVTDSPDNCPAFANPAQNMPTWAVPANDADCDGFNKTREEWVGTLPAKRCPNTATPNNEVVDAWPTDFNDSQVTNLSDVVLMGPVYNQATGTDPAKRRFDLNASGNVSLADVVLMGPFYNKNCS